MEMLTMFQEASSLLRSIHLASIFAPNLWQPPAQGCLKINFNAPFFKEMGCCGLGVVVRDHYGRFSARVAEKITGDAKGVVAASNFDEEDVFIMGNIVEDTKKWFGFHLYI
ncbi:hypothetical protein ACH5RR_039447 [Cinchona calisaya]|uniref:RNase H type-1 domain-containing protein n=1 Tax=Cinchona calisaya TaxID=153742 RepID=A0ABD2XYB4_9GENT